jgi:hypothetical protein
MKNFFFITLLAVISFNCQKEISTENGSTGSTTALPTLTTTGATSITSTTSVSGGSITSNGGATVTSRGVCWSTTPNPVVTGNHTTDGNGIGTFTSSITSLTPATLYYVRAYATNSEGTAYGTEISFTTTITTNNLPTLTTTAISSITTTTASSGGNITTDGGAIVIARGVCWSTTTNPIVTGNHTTDGTGIGSFTSSIAGLNSGTIYHVRAYATNSVGTAYGNELILTTASPDVFIAGSDSNGATVWLNGIRTNFNATSSSGKSIFVNNSDVYVGGNFRNSSNNVFGAVWKNGVVTAFPQGTDVNQVIVENNDVYAVGSAGYVDIFNVQKSVAKCWKNGIEINPIPNQNTLSYFVGIAVKGSDVYTIGHIFLGGAAGRDVATIWKNGNPTYLTNGTNDGYASGIFINGTDIYVCGTEQIGGAYYPLLWKNNIKINLTTPNLYGRMQSVTVVNDTVYVVGNSSNGVTDQATIWKNGVASFLPATSPNKNSYAGDIKVLGNDTFVCGLEVGTGARYWKNGIGFTLPSIANYAQGNSIFVK